jgi:hypothetical protein
MPGVRAHPATDLQDLFTPAGIVPEYLVMAGHVFIYYTVMCEKKFLVDLGCLDNILCAGVSRPEIPDLVFYIFVI